LFHRENQIGFICFANYTPIRKGVTPIFHFNRIVVHPDYAGMGLGIRLTNLTSEYMHRVYGYRIMGKFSSVPVFKAMIKDKAWKFLGEKRIMGSMNYGHIDRKSGFREFGIKTYHFEFRGTMAPNLSA
jgi:GNAT superfamily N-acetyltransferase